MSRSKFVVVVESDEARSGGEGNPIVTKAGEKFIIVESSDGWGDFENIPYAGEIPSDAFTFDTKESAEKFTKSWEGFPWWCKPNGNYEIIEVIPKIEIMEKLVGYERKEN